MKRIVYIALIVGLSLAAFGSIFSVWVTGIFPPISGSIADSQRFSNVLERENMSAWFHGHTHPLHSRENVRMDRWRVTFINSGSIKDRPESLFLIFENGKKEVTVKSRNHSDSEWNDLESKFSFDLDHNFQYGKENLIIWIFSDIQPKDQEVWEIFENTIEDVNNLSVEPEMAFILGDLVDEGREEDLQKFKKYLENSKIPWENFYSLTGNHEFNPYFTGNLSNYQTYIREELNYTVKRGNLNFILMSDNGAGITGYISEEKFEWWEEIIGEDKNKNHITLTHQPLEGTTPGSKTGIRDKILESDTRFMIIIMPNVLLILIGVAIAFETSS